MIKNTLILVSLLTIGSCTFAQKEEHPALEPYFPNAITSIRKDTPPDQGLKEETDPYNLLMAYTAVHQYFTNNRKEANKDAEFVIITIDKNNPKRIDVIIYYKNKNCPSERLQLTAI